MAKKEVKIKMIPFSEFKRKALKDPEIKKAYDDLQPEYDLIASKIQKRIDKENAAHALDAKIWISITP